MPDVVIKQTATGLRIEQGTNTLKIATVGVQTTTSAVAALDWKASVRAATTADITLEDEQTIDGVAVVSGDRVLVKDQDDAEDNGIYVASPNEWRRAPDANTDAKVTSGLACAVEEGTTNADTVWLLTTNNPIVLDTTELTFSTFASLDHGEHAGGTLHDEATTSLAGFMPAEHFSFIEALLPMALAESLTIAVDYGAGAAVTGLTAGSFRTQDEVDAIGATFKYVTEVFSALPKIILPGVTVTINVAAGVHRPLAASGGIAFRFNDKVMIGSGNVVFQGPTSASWGTRVAAQTITAHATGSSDGLPYIDVAGTPFAGDDHVGCFAVLSTGTILQIGKHTDSRLYVQNVLSGITNGATTVTIKYPTAIFRNSAADVTSVANSTLSIEIESGNDTNAIAFNDIVLDPFGATSVGVAHLTGKAAFTRCVFDQVNLNESFARTPDGMGWRVGNNTIPSSPAQLSLTDCSYREEAHNGDGPVRVISRLAGANLVRCVIRGGKDGCLVADGAFLRLQSTRFFEVGYDSGAGSEATLGATRVQGLLAFLDNAIGAWCSFGGHTTVPAIYFEGGRLDNGFATTARARMDDNTGGPCVVLGAAAAIGMAPASSATIYPAFVDGGGNTDVGFELQGPNATLYVTDDTDLAGAVGAIRLADGTVLDWSDIPNDSSASDDNGNVVKKVAA